MFLQLSNKENRQPFEISKKNEGNMKVRVSQSQINSFQSSPQSVKQVQEPTSDSVNLQIFQTQLVRIQAALQNERRQKSTISQEKIKLQGQIKVQQIQRDNQYRQNDKLRTQLKEFMNKLRESQTKVNTQTSEFYAVKNEVTSLQIQLKKYKQAEKVAQQKVQRLKKDNSDFQSQVIGLNTNVSKLVGELKLKQTEIDFLRRSIQQLEFEAKKLSAANAEGRKVSNQEVDKIYRQLENWKNAFEKKEQELQTKTVVLSEQNNVMKRTIDELSTQLQRPTSSLHRTCSLPQPSNDKSNQYHVRLFVKENQILKLNQTVKQLQQKVQGLQLENALLAKKASQNTVFSPSGFKRYTQVQNAILKNSESKKLTRQLKNDVQSKQKQIELLSEQVTETEKQLQSTIIEYKKLESDIQSQRIYHENTVNELNSLKTKLERDLHMLKSKIQGLTRECQEKDRIIVAYVNKQKN